MSVWCSVSRILGNLRFFGYYHSSSRLVEFGFELVPLIDSEGPSLVLLPVSTGVWLQ